MAPRNIKALEARTEIPGHLGTRYELPLSVHERHKKAPLDNVKLRQAINYAIPIDAMLQNLLFGYATQMKSPLPSLMPGYDPTLSPYRYDVAKAKALVQEAGRGSEPVTLELAVRVGWTTHEQAATWIQAELEKIGLKVAIVRETDAAFRQAAIGGKHLLSIEAWQSWVNDPIFHMNANFHSTSTNTNSSFYNNPVLDKLLTDNMHEANADKRAGRRSRRRRRSSSTTRCGASCGTRTGRAWRARISPASSSAGIPSIVIGISGSRAEEQPTCSSVPSLPSASPW